MNGPQDAPSGGHGTSVLVAMPEAITRAALCAAIEREDGLRIVADAADGDGALAAVKSSEPHVAVIHAGLEVGGGQSLCQALKRCDPPPRVIVLSDSEDESALLSALEAGADGYLPPQSGLADLMAATRTVGGGHPYVPPHMLGVLLRVLIDDRRDEDRVVARFAALSSREKEIVGLLLEGQANEAIARRLSISPQTARTHIQNVLKKLDVHSRVEAVAVATKYRLLERFPPPTRRPA